jgi:virginiamycin B lyase
MSCRWIAAVASLACFSTLAIVTQETTRGQAAPESLTGRVTSAAEGPMEGVVVTVQRHGDTVLTSVSTDSAGRYRFPRHRVGAGTYAVTVRAAGYVLEKDGAAVEVGASVPAIRDLRLAPASRDQLADQLTSVDWWNSMPGTPEQKDLLIRKIVNCGFCHDMTRTMRSRYTAEQMLSVISRMNTYAVDNSSGCGIGSQVVCDSRTPGRFQGSSQPAPPEKTRYWFADAQALAHYLASVNLSGGRQTWDFPLKAMPRPSAKASTAIVTVFPVPRQPSVIHDLDVDSKGNVWYGDSGWSYLTKFDPKAGKFTEYGAQQYRTAAPGRTPVLGVQDIQVDTEDNVWARVGGNKMAVFDTKAERWREFEMPATPWAFITPFYKGQTATVWTTGRVTGPEGPGPLQAFRLNFKKGVVDVAYPIMVDASGKDFSNTRVFDVYGQEDPIQPYCYQIDRDPDDNFICADFFASNIITMDAKTGKTHVYPTPTPHAGPRRGHADEQGRFWFAEFLADKVGRFEPKGGRITEFPMSTKYMSAYAAVPDHTGSAWATSTGSDRVVRINPATREMVEYLMPVYYDARTIRVDPSTKTPTVWLPNKNLSQLIRIELPE